MGLLLGIGLIAVVLAWLLQRKKPAPEPGEEREPVDVEELEAAEREVRDLDLQQRPEDGFEGDDWGPGTVRER